MPPWFEREREVRVLILVRDSESYLCACVLEDVLGGARCNSAAHESCVDETWEAKM